MDKKKMFTALVTIVERKRAMGFKPGSRLCRDCCYFLRTPVGELNRCTLGDFPCGPRHGCSCHSPGTRLPLVLAKNNLKATMTVQNG